MSITAFDHLVVRVADLEKGIETYRDVLGLELDRTDTSDALGIRQAFFNLPGGGFIELISPTSSENPVGQALESRGEGMHTISFQVDDLATTCVSFKENGARLIGEGGPMVFVHPRSACGILLQLTQKN